ncbi:MAG: TRAP transporter small permease [Pseudomonadota bacterium]
MSDASGGAAALPRSVRRSMRRFLDVYYRLLQVLLTLLMVGLVLPVTMQILSRYTGWVPRYIWTEEIARFCFVWIVMIGAMIAVRDGTHFDVDVLPHSKRPRLEALSKLFVHFAVGAVAVIFLVFGYDFAVLGARQTSEIASLPMLTIYIAWPLAGLTWLLFLVERVQTDLALFRKGGS